MSFPMPACAQAIASTGKTVILIADDVEVNRLVVAAYLPKEEYDIHFAFDGHQAVDAYRALQPDIVLMDVAMPGMDGLDATAHIRQLEAGPKRVRVIGLTAYATAEDRQVCLDSGMDGFLCKPIKRESLLAALQS